MNAGEWSWLAAAVSIVGPWISGRNPRWGWVYGIANQAVWVTYGLATGQHGMIALSVVYVGLYARNIYNWRHGRLERKAVDTVEAMAAKLRDAGWQVAAPEPAMGGIR